jgi:acyl-coenzyme A thioesterase PaaI-like protein
MTQGALDGHLFGEDQPCFGCGPRHPIGFRLAFAKNGDAISTEMTPEERFQGPPGIMHGGLVTTLADEVAAWAVIGLLGKFGFTAHLEAKLHKPVRIGRPVLAEGRLEGPATRLAKVRVTLRQDDALAFEGTFRFVILDEAGAEKLLGGPLPPAWRAFSR